MYSFKTFLTEEEMILILEAVSANTKGVLHELLTGYHLNNGKHMEKHPNAEGDSPKEAHDKLQKTISPEEYDTINRRAKAAAADIKKTVKGKISNVHWTSKPGDIERSTGIKSSQKEDASDIVITAKHNNKPHYTGVSLKVTDTKKQVPISNPGMEATHGGSEILEKHRQHLMKKFPALKTAGNKEQRKELMKSTPGMEEYVRKANTKTLNDIATHLHNALTTMPKKDLVKHIRSNVLHAHATPMQEMGHDHIRHTTHGTSSFSFTHHNPAQDHEHILKDHNNISVEKSGNSVMFKHKGKMFAKHRMKFESQSDPLSSIKGSGSLD